MGQIRARGFDWPVPAMVAMVLVLVLIVVMEAPVVGSNCIGAAVAVGDR